MCLCGVCQKGPLELGDGGLFSRKKKRDHTKSSQSVRGEKKINRDEGKKKRKMQQKERNKLEKKDKAKKKSQREMGNC